MSGPDMLRTGIYTVSDAAALLNVSSQKIRAWIDGWPGTKKPPIISNELGWIESQQAFSLSSRLAFSFANLMELRFVSFFVDAGVSLHEIRTIMGEVREQMKISRPFATNLVFKTDGKRIVAETFHRNGAHTLIDLRSRNYEMIEITYRSLKDGVVYDVDGVARAWFPRPQRFPNVVLHPGMSFGRPIIRPSGIPTEAIADAAVAESSVVVAADLFGISPKLAQQAVDFQLEIRRAA